MVKFSIEDLQKHFRCSEQLHNCILAELVYLLSSCPSNITSDSVIDKDGLRKYLYGNEYGTSIEKILSLSDPQKEGKNQLKKQRQAQREQQRLNQGHRLPSAAVPAEAALRKAVPKAADLRGEYNNG